MAIRRLYDNIQNTICQESWQELEGSTGHSTLE